jgi:4-methyl-5(b-hydroxyethyl)-thiazole monophosphate biosynthesis
MPTVLIPLAKGFEELEAVTLIDILRRANITVVTASLSDNTLVTARHGVRLVADTSLETVIYDDFDIIILPGGQPGTDTLNQDPHIHAVLKRLYQSGKAVAAICAAPMVLAHAGLLDGKVATCFPSVLMPAEWPNITLSTESVVIDGRVITSKGPGTALDFALSIVEYLKDSHTRNAVEASLVGSTQ